MSSCAFRLVYILKQAKKQIQTSIQNSPNKPTPKNLPKFRAKNLRFASTSSIKRETRKFHIDIEIVQWQ